jgi:hypothetical protein
MVGLSVIEHAGYFDTSPGPAIPEPTTRHVLLDFGCTDDQATCPVPPKAEQLPSHETGIEHQSPIPVPVVLRKSLYNTPLEVYPSKPHMASIKVLKPNTHPVTGNAL